MRPADSKLTGFLSLLSHRFRKFHGLLCLGDIFEVMPSVDSLHLMSWTIVGMYATTVDDVKHARVATAASRPI